MKKVRLKHVIFSVAFIFWIIIVAITLDTGRKVTGKSLLQRTAQGIGAFIGEVASGYEEGKKEN